MPYYKTFLEQKKMTLFPNRILKKITKTLDINFLLDNIIILTTPFQRLQALHEVVGAFKGLFSGQWLIWIIENVTNCMRKSILWHIWLVQQKWLFAIFWDPKSLSCREFYFFFPKNSSSFPLTNIHRLSSFFRRNWPTLGQSSFTVLKKKMSLHSLTVCVRTVRWLRWLHEVTGGGKCLLKCL